MATAAQTANERVADILLIGAGGIAAPVAIALAEAGVSSLRIVDEDRVELSNLHRQILFGQEDIGKTKLEALKDRLSVRSPDMRISNHPGRCLPHTALELFQGATVIVDATDNFPSRFLIADAARLAGVPVVHAAAVRWQATVMAVSGVGQPCYRCLFEDLPEGPAPDCATAGVVGPVCGVAGALAADLVMRIERGDSSAFGGITTYDGRVDQLRRVVVRPRPNCPLCGASPRFRTIEATRYLSAASSIDLTVSGAAPLDGATDRTTVRFGTPER